MRCMCWCCTKCCVHACSMLVVTFWVTVGLGFYYRLSVTLYVHPRAASNSTNHTNVPINFKRVELADGSKKGLHPCRGVSCYILFVIWRNPMIWNGSVVSDGEKKPAEPLTCCSSHGRKLIRNVNGQPLSRGLPFVLMKHFFSAPVPRKASWKKGTKCLNKVEGCTGRMVGLRQFHCSPMDDNSLETELVIVVLAQAERHGWKHGTSQSNSTSTSISLCRFQGSETPHLVHGWNCMNSQL